MRERGTNEERDKRIVLHGESVMVGEDWRWETEKAVMTLKQKHESGMSRSITSKDFERQCWQSTWQVGIK